MIRLTATKDQQLDKSEASADPQLIERFAFADTNSDGYISKSEYMASKALEDGRNPEPSYDH